MFSKIFFLVLVALCLFASAMGGVHHVRYDNPPPPEPHQQLGILGMIKEAADDILSTAGVHNQ